MSRRVVIAIVLVLVLAVGVPTALAVIHAQTGRRAAEELAAHQLWPQARDRLASYLWLHPRDAQARLLLADAFVNDDALVADEAALQAIHCLADVPDSSPLAAEARFREAGYWFLLLQKPSRAEPLLLEAIDLGAGLRAYQLLWTLLSFTGRSAESEEVFWRIYELTAEEERPLVLRQWYLVEFFPLEAQEYLDRQMLILAPDETSSRNTESGRYIRFQKRDPESPKSHAAIAQWCQEEGDPEFALRIIHAAAKQLPTAKSDPFLLSVGVATHLDLGQFNEAQACLENWPDSDRGHAYWKSQAAILDVVQGQHEEALKAYDRALHLWPGPIKWGLMHHKAACLTRLGRPEEAAAVKDRAAQVKALLRDEVQHRLRLAVDSLNDPQQLAEVAQFYRQLGRNREATGWEQYIQRLQTRVAHKP